jgi:hypothetical protein
MKRIEAFNFVRDIPYRLPLSAEEADHGCEGKHRILYTLLRGIGMQIRPRICESRWTNIPNFPRELLTKPEDDECWHLYLEAKIKNRWVPLDATNGLRNEKSIPSK